MSATRDALLDGAPPAMSELLQARALHYGDGVFRTALIADGTMHDAPRQIALLKRDAARLDLDLDESPLRQDVAQLAGRQVRAVLKLMVWRAPGTRGYRSDTRATRRLLTLHALPRWPATHWGEGVAVDFSPMTLASQPRLAGIKHLNRLEQILASRDWPLGVEERLMCDAAGRVIGGTRTNLFWVRRGTLHTSPLDECGVAGAMRERVLEAAERSGVPVRQTSIGREELAAADELFLTNSLIGIWPVRQLGGHRWQHLGAITGALQGAIVHPPVHA